MRFNATKRMTHPAADGYELEFHVTDTQDAGFATGKATYEVKIPNFSVESVEFSGKNTLYKPTGEGSLFLADFDEIPVDSISLAVEFASDLYEVGDKKSLQNIKYVEVFTGSNSYFTPDLDDFTNRVTRRRVNLSPDNPIAAIDISIDELPVVEPDIIYSKNIFYKPLPYDFLTYRQSIETASGEMLQPFPEEIATGGVINISRSEGTDVILSKSLVELDRNETTNTAEIILHDDTILDFEMNFIISSNTMRTEIKVEDGSQFKIEYAGSEGQSAVYFEAGNQNTEFKITSEWEGDANGDPQKVGYFIE